MELTSLTNKKIFVTVIDSMQDISGETDPRSEGANTLVQSNGHTLWVKDTYEEILQKMQQAKSGAV